MKSISNRLIIFVSTIILVLCLGLGFAAYQGSSKALLNQTDELILEIADKAAAEAFLAVDKQLASLETLAANSNVLQNPQSPMAVAGILKAEPARWHQCMVHYAQMGAYATVDALFRRDREYFRPPCRKSCQ